MGYHARLREASRDVEATWSAPVVAKMIDEGHVRVAPLELTWTGMQIYSSLGPEGRQKMRPPSRRRVSRVRWRRTGDDK